MVKHRTLAYVNYKLAQIYYGSKTGKDIKRDWFVYFSYRHPETGKFVRFKRTGGINRIHTLKERIEEAKKLQQAINDELMDGYNPFASQEQNYYTIASAIDFALERKKLSLDPDSFTEYRNRTRRLLNKLKGSGLEDMNIKDIERKHMRDLFFKVRQTSSAVMHNNYLLAMQALFSVLVVNDIIPYSPVHLIKTERLPQMPGFLSMPAAVRNKVKELAYAESFGFGLILETIYSTGIRRKEVLLLRWKNIDLDNMSIHITGDIAKNDKIRLVPCKASLIEKYRQWRDKNAPLDDWYVFGNDQQHSSGVKRFKPASLTTKFSRIMHVPNGIDKKYKLYGLKYTGSDDKIMAGISIEALKGQYGHATVKMTRRYTQKLQEKEAQEIREKSPDF